MDLNTTHQNEWSKSAIQVRSGIGTILAIVIFWAIMLALISCPAWLPGLIESLIHP